MTHEEARSLREANLNTLSHEVALPKYSRKNLIPAIVHIGVGVFNRSHQAVYLDDLLGITGTQRICEWGIGLMPADRMVDAALKEQDHLYTVFVRDAEGETARVIGSLIAHTYAPECTGEAIVRLSAPETEIISLTVTEGGYFLDADTHRFDNTHPDIQFDLQHPETPRTFPGYIVQAARRRINTGGKPFTILSGDNIQGNGDATRSTILGFAEMVDASVCQWIREHVSFPNSMVDRITPKTTEKDRAALVERYGVADSVPVVTEPFRQWVLEDKFVGVRPAFDRVGVQFTTDVVPYEQVKIRLLNGGHFAIAYIGALLSIPLVSDAIGDHQIKRFLQEYHREVLPAVPLVPGIDLGEYTASVLKRFSNPTILDQIDRICSGGTGKLISFILPTMRELKRQRRALRILPAIIASWLFYLRGKREDGSDIEIEDPLKGQLISFLQTGGMDAGRALSVRSLFGDLMEESDELIAQVQQFLDCLHESGARRMMESAISQARGGLHV
jgi:mannitol 2-dehydrogenase